MIDSESEIDEIVAKIIKVVKAIEKVHGNKVPEKDITEEMPCPICEVGTMHYSISSYNGHRAAHCENGCFGQFYE